MSTQTPNRSGYLYGVCSFIATLFSNILHPLQIIKTRFQSHDGKHNNQNIVPKYSSVLSALKTISRSEGLLGVYKGFIINTFSQSLSQALFFTIYENRLIHLNKTDTSYMSAVSRASLEASVAASVLTHPIWTIQTRMLLTTGKINEIENMKFNIMNIYKEYGVRGFYRGLPLNLLLSINGFIQMYTFEGCKLVFNRLGGDHQSELLNHIFNYKAFISGGTSKIVSSLFMYPLVTVRTRYQQEQFIQGSLIPKYKSILDVVVKIVKLEGVPGFYKGFSINFLKGFLQRGVYFYFYELTKSVVGLSASQAKSNSARS